MLIRVHSSSVVGSFVLRWLRKFHTLSFDPSPPLKSSSWAVNSVLYNIMWSGRRWWLVSKDSEGYRGSGISSSLVLLWRPLQQYWNSPGNSFYLRHFQLLLPLLLPTCPRPSHCLRHRDTTTRDSYKVLESWWKYRIKCSGIIVVHWIARGFVNGHRSKDSVGFFAKEESAGVH